MARVKGLLLIDLFGENLLPFILNSWCLTIVRPPLKYMLILRNITYLATYILMLYKWSNSDSSAWSMPSAFKVGILSHTCGVTYECVDI